MTKIVSMINRNDKGGFGLSGRYYFEKGKSRKKAIPAEVIWRGLLFL